MLSYAVRYGIKGDELLATLKCESKLNAKAWNKSDPNGGSKGVGQFQPSTFAKYSKLAGIQNGDVWNPFDNINTVAYMFSIHQEHQWSCFNTLYGSY